MTENTKHILDWASVVTALGTLMNWMPQIAALLSALWMLTRLYEWAAEKYRKFNRKP